MRTALKRRRRRPAFRRFLLRFVLSVVSHPWRTLAVAAVFLAASIVFAAMKLTVSTDQNKLFSSNVPFFRQWLDFTAKFPENEAIYILIEPPKGSDPAHPPPARRWVAAADAITRRLRELPRYVKSVDSHVPLDRLGDQGILFESREALPRRLADAKRFEFLARLWGEGADSPLAFLGTTPAERFLAGLLWQGRISGFDEEKARFVQLLADHWNQTLAGDGAVAVPDLAAAGADDPKELGYYFLPDEEDRSRRLLLVRVYPVEDYDSLTAQSETVDAIRRATLEAAQEFPEFTVGVTGRPAVDADELQTTDRDSHRAEVVALIAVFAGLVVMLRSFWLALAAEVALAVGIGWTFGYATLAVGELNLLSLVFLIALIGIGMDYLVQILTRYRREAALHHRPREIWIRVFRRVAAPINTACLGAAGAFLVSTLTDFRGAADLGLIAGGGLLLTLLAGYTVLPALLALWPTKAWRRLPPQSSAPLPSAPPADLSAADDFLRRRGREPTVLSSKNRGLPPSPIKSGNKNNNRIAAHLPVSPLRRLALPILWIVALTSAVPFMLRSHFDPGLLNLRAQNLPSVQLIRKLQTWSAVVLSKDLGQLRKIRESLDGAATVASTESILDAQDNSVWLAQHARELPTVRWAAPPPVRSEDLAKWAASAESLASALTTSAGTGGELAARPLRDFAATLNATRTQATEGQRLTRRLSEWQCRFVAYLQELMGQLNPGRLDVAKLPPELRGHFVSADGTYALYINPNADLWDQKNLERFVLEVSARVDAVHASPGVTGIAVDIYFSTGSVERSFYQAAAYALGLIFVLVWLDLRHVGQTLAAVSVLAFGLPMLVALMGGLGIRWNFANFFGLPILIGAGHEYGVFLVHRYREARDSPARAWRPWDVSDRALLLCAYVTATSFAFFWMLGHHEGLKSLGLVMALGTVCIYLAAVLVLRPILLWQLGRRRIAPQA